MTLTQLPVAVIKRLPFKRLFFLNKYHGILKRIGSKFRTKTYFGAVMECSVVDLIGKTILFYGRWEPNVSYALERLLGPGEVVADVGANIGYDSLLSSSIVGPTGAVVAIEASPSIFAKLRRNIDFNEANNIRTIHGAVSNGKGQVALYGAPNDNLGASTTVKSAGFRQEAIVTCNTLEAYLRPEELQRLSLIKIDIEGAEIPVLRDIIAKIEMYPKNLKILVEASFETIDIHSWEAIFDDLHHLGFSVYSIENDYEDDWYLSWRKANAPVLLTEIPTKQTDLLLTRQPFPLL